MFSPSEKQMKAIMAMENFLGYDEYRDSFSHSNDFQAYWDQLDEQCKKQRAIGNAMGRRKQSGKTKKQYIYEDEHKLKMYALKYIAKYSPSAAKLRSQLLKKTAGNLELSESVARQLMGSLDDTDTAMVLVKSLILRAKTEMEIRSKLREKLFDTQTINDVIEQLREKEGSLIDEFAVTQKIQQLIGRRKSKKEIQQTLRANGDDNQRILEIIDELYDYDQEYEILSSHIHSFQRQGISTDKIIERLRRKAFDYDQIRHCLEELE